MDQVYLTNSILQATEPTGDVSGAYAAFRTAVWEVIEMTQDPNSYMLAWKLIDQFAKADLLEFELTRSLEALNRLKAKAKETEQLLP